MLIIDAHTHVFPTVCGRVAAGLTRGLGFGRVAMGPDERQLIPSCGEVTAHVPGTLVASMDWAGVDRAVLLQGPVYGDLNDYVRLAVEAYPERLWGAAYVDPWQEDGRRATELALAQPGFRAVKIEFTERTGLSGLYPQARLDDPELTWLWEALERRGLALVLDLGTAGSRSYQTEAVREIAQSHPRLRIVIAHLAQPKPQVEADSRLWRMWQEQIDLGRLPNVWFDTASLLNYVADEDYPFPSAGRHVRGAIERIGPEKVLWGTDMPALMLTATYRQMVKAGLLHVSFLSAEDQALVMGGNAAHVFGGTG